MKNPSSPLYLSVPFVFLFLFSWVLSTASSAHYYTHEEFLRCLTNHIPDNSSDNLIIYTARNPSYSSVLDFSAQNLRFVSPRTRQPLAIITPTLDSHVQAAVFCCRKYDVRIRVRSGGHDFEGLSFVARVPFAIVDLTNMRSIDVNVESATAWIEGGARLGEVYYHIANKSRTLAFPAGLCPTVGVGGHFSGGGYGTLLRKHGVAADHVIDAKLIDANGRILDRKAMGEDLFWAIRGGGGGNFGIVLAWKVELVPVPETVTQFSVQRTLEQNATQLIHQWQYVADKTDENLYIRVLMRSVNNTENGNRTILASFDSLYLGGVDTLLPLMQKDFPELGLTRQDCTEMRWVNATLFFGGVSSVDDLLNRTYPYRQQIKLKSDYVKDPIPEYAFDEIWKRLHVEELGVPVIVFSPYGGKMSQISPSAIPFPHRAGIKYGIVYQSGWTEEGKAVSNRHLSWIRELYTYMTPYVSKNPREGYVNYRDLDLGRNNEGYTSYEQARVWGEKYFLNNFKRLVQVKTMVDSRNFFRNEQSIPPLSRPWNKGGNVHHPHAGRDSY